MGMCYRTRKVEGGSGDVVCSNFGNKALFVEIFGGKTKALFHRYREGKEKSKFEIGDDSPLNVEFTNLEFLLIKSCDTLLCTFTYCFSCFLYS